MTIQEFNTTFSYIPGKANAIVDVLSHNDAPVSLITNKPNMLTPEDFKTYQLSDMFCASLLYLESGNSPNLPKLHVNVNLFFLQNDLLYKSSSTSPDDLDEFHPASYSTVFG